jgi:hypothetical protein
MNRETFIDSLVYQFRHLIEAAIRESAHIHAHDTNKTLDESEFSAKLQVVIKSAQCEGLSKEIIYKMIDESRRKYSFQTENTNYQNAA